MQFWKMNGAGNDFIIINNMTEKIPSDRLPDMARTVCERHMSIGADALMVADHSDTGADFRMIFYNSDGSIGEMCGNGARCICRYGYENGLAGETQTIQTDAGPLTGLRITERQYRVRLQDPQDTALELTLTTADGKQYPCSYTVVGVPHCVVPMKGLKDLDRGMLFRLGRELRNHPAFPRGANVDFIDPDGSGEVQALTYERGVEDFTYACGTGAGSIAAVLTLSGKRDGKGVQIRMPGGLLTVDVVRSGDGSVKDLYLTGPTNIVAKGEICDEDLVL